MPDVQGTVVHRICAGSEKRARREDECGRKFYTCHVCGQSVGTYATRDLQNYAIHHSIPALRQCDCGNGIWDENDYLCDECRDATLQTGLRNGYAT